MKKMHELLFICVASLLFTSCVSSNSASYIVTPETYKEVINDYGFLYPDSSITYRHDYHVYIPGQYDERDFDIYEIDHLKVRYSYEDNEIFYELHLDKNPLSRTLYYYDKEDEEMYKKESSVNHIANALDSRMFRVLDFSFDTYLYDEANHQYKKKDSEPIVIFDGGNYLYFNDISFSFKDNVLQEMKVIYQVKAPGYSYIFDDIFEETITASKWNETSVTLPEAKEEPGEPTEMAGLKYEWYAFEGDNIDEKERELITSSRIEFIDDQTVHFYSDTLLYHDMLVEYSYTQIGTYRKEEHEIIATWTKWKYNDEEVPIELMPDPINVRFRLGGKKSMVCEIKLLTNPNTNLNVIYKKAK